MHNPCRKNTGTTGTLFWRPLKIQNLRTLFAVPVYKPIEAQKIYILEQKQLLPEPIKYRIFTILFQLFQKIFDIKSTTFEPHFFHLVTHENF
jgi:hypothetical protein